MHFDIVVKTHTAWRMKLESCLVHDDVCGMDPSALEHNCKCQIGHWLQTDGKVWQLAAEYVALDTAHKMFHHAVAEVVRLVQTGAVVDRRLLLEEHPTFIQATDAELVALQNMQRKILGPEKPA